MAKAVDIRVDVVVHLSVCERKCSSAKYNYPTPAVRIQKYRCATCTSITNVHSDIEVGPANVVPDAYSEPPCVVKSGHNWYLQDVDYR